MLLIRLDAGNGFKKIPLPAPADPQQIKPLTAACRFADKISVSRPESAKGVERGLFSGHAPS